MPNHPSDIKLLLISPLPPPIGGITVWTEKYINLLNQKKVYFQILDISNKVNSSKLRQFYNFLRLNFKIKILLKNKKFNVIHLNTSLSLLGTLRDKMIIKIAEKHQIPVVINYRCNIKDQIVNASQEKRVMHLLKHAKLNLLLNDTSLEYALKFSSYSKKIPNFISYQVNTINKTSENINEILFVGHLVEAKGIDLIINLAKIHDTLIFKLVGRNIAYKNVSFPKNIIIFEEADFDTLKYHYLNSDLFIFPSLSEGFSNSMLEAMSFGLPIIASNVGANLEMIEDKGGFIIKNNSLDKYNEAIELIKPYELRQEMSIWNINKVKNTYTQEIVIKRWIDHYHSVLGLENNEV